MTVLTAVAAAGRRFWGWAVGALVGKVADLAATEAGQPGTSWGRGWLDLVWCREGRVALELRRLLLGTLLLLLGLLDRLL